MARYVFDLSIVNWWYPSTPNIWYLDVIIMFSISNDDNQNIVCLHLFDWLKTVPIRLLMCQVHFYDRQLFNEKKRSYFVYFSTHWFHERYFSFFFANLMPRKPPKNNNKIKHVRALNEVLCVFYRWRWIFFEKVKILRVKRFCTIYGYMGFVLYCVLNLKTLTKQTLYLLTYIN